MPENDETKTEKPPTANPADVPAAIDEREKTDNHRIPCQHCGEWMSTRGIRAHEEYCDDRPGASTDPTDGSGGIATCPDCGNEKDGSSPAVLPADSVMTAMEQRGTITESHKALLEKHQYMCNRCAEVFGK